jgi:FKBP-type peptidyl-prolyl cis-trans isomerase FkpA
MKSQFWLLAAVVMVAFAACKKDMKTQDGYSYSVLEQGTGEMPDTSDYVFFTVKVYVQDSLTKKDSLVQEDAEGAEPVIQITNPMDPSMPKWIQEILAKSKVGSKYRMVMPMDSISFQVPPALLSFNALYYDIVIKKISTNEEFEKYRQAKIAEQEAKVKANMEKLGGIEELTKKTLADYKAGSLQTVKLPSGLEYYMVQDGQGDKAEKGNTVSVHYYGVLEATGVRFDDSYSRGDEFQFVAGTGGVIQGWDEGVALLKKGAKVFLFVPSAMAYGKMGAGATIPPDSDLVFYIELLGVKK